MAAHLFFRTTVEADWPGIERLLKSAGLPLDGALEHQANFIVGEANGAFCSVGGFERYQHIGLLRSVAVNEAMRGQGWGDGLLNALKARAAAQGISELYLLTTTASSFFKGRGFTTIERKDAPIALHASRQFQGICPASATTMVAHLDRQGG